MLAGRSTNAGTDYYQCRGTFYLQAHVVTRSLMAVVRAWSGEGVALRG